MAHSTQYWSGSTWSTVSGFGLNNSENAASSFHVLNAPYNYKNCFQEDHIIHIRMEHLPLVMDNKTPCSAATKTLSNPCSSQE